MSELRVIGIDPGPVPGFVVLGIVDGRLRRTEVVQCGHGIAVDVFCALLRTASPKVPVVVQVERFVVGRRASRSSTAGAGEVTRDLVGALSGVVLGLPDPSFDTRMLQRSAAQVKPWATDARLEAAGLLDATKGMRHARDAARHALYAAVHDGGLPDPLSKDWSR